MREKQARNNARTLSAEICVEMAEDGEGRRCCWGLSFVGWVEKDEALDAEFGEFVPVVFFNRFGLGAAFFLGEFVPCVLADISDQITVGHADDQFIPERFDAKFLVAIVGIRRFFDFGGDAQVVVLGVEFDGVIKAVLVGQVEDFLFKVKELGVGGGADFFKIPLRDLGGQSRHFHEGR